MTRLPEESRGGRGAGPAGQTYGCHSAGQAGATAAAAAWPEHRAGTVDGPARGPRPIWTVLDYTEPMSLSGILVPRNRLPQVSIRGWGAGGEDGAPWASQRSASASVLTLASHGSTQPHGRLRFLCLIYPRHLQLRSVTSSGDKKGQDRLPQ